MAGYGTDQLVKQVATEKGVLFRGEITDEALDEMLTTCKGAIVYQEHGSGALTRVCEYLLAGVPVFANSHAARSYYNLPGIYEFETLEQLGDQMRAVTLAEQIFQTLFPPDAKCLRQRILGLLK